MKSLRKGSLLAGSGVRRMRMSESGSGAAVRQMEDGYSKQSTEGDAKSEKGEKKMGQSANGEDGYNKQSANEDAEKVKHEGSGEKCS
ncbi:hypothetical protein SLA2020_232350 [Shorea laevis]